MNEKKAYFKGWKIIQSCLTDYHIRVAYNYVHNFKLMFGETSSWNDLKSLCRKKRKRIKYD